MRRECTRKLSCDFAAMTIRVFILTAAAGIAGWLGASWLDASRGTNERVGINLASSYLTSPHSDDYLTSLRTFSVHGQGSARLAELAALLRRVPVSEIPALLAAVEQWPKGTVRDVAIALLHARQSPELVDVPASDKPVPRSRALAAALAAGTETKDWERTVADWASLDFAAASAAVLKMPPGELRNTAVDKVAAAMTHDDAAAAMAFILESGEKHLGAGAAWAWAKLVAQDNAAGTGTMRKLSGVQQDSLAAALAEVVREAAVHDFSTVTPVADENLELLARVARSMGESPGRDALLSEIFRRKPMMFDNPGETEITPESNPEHALALAAMLERLTRESPDQAISVLKDGMPNLTDEGNVSALTAAAPRVLPQLCRTGHVKEAVQLLDRIKDRGAWRESFHAVLPYWMDADPAAARTAFEAAPLSALERERWRRHPAFLLHP